MDNQQQYHEENQESGSSSSSFLLGAIIGGAVGAVTALLFAPKSGRELRTEIAERSNEMYENANSYLSELNTEVGTAVTNTVNEGKTKAQGIIDSARRQAEQLLQSAESVLKEAKVKATGTKSNLQERIDTVREAAKASAETFKTEMNAAKQEIKQAAEETAESAKEKMGGEEPGKEPGDPFNNPEYVPKD